MSVILITIKSFPFLLLANRSSTKCISTKSQTQVKNRQVIPFHYQDKELLQASKPSGTSSEQVEPTYLQSHQCNTKHSSSLKLLVPVRRTPWIGTHSHRGQLFTQGNIETQRHLTTCFWTERGVEESMAPGVNTSRIPKVHQSYPQ